MTPEELAAIRERDARHRTVAWDGTIIDMIEDPDMAPHDRRALLAHIDAITEAVEGLERLPNEDGDDSDWISATEVLALLRGTDDSSRQA